MSYAIGVDTGDTFTDAVLFDLMREQVVSVAKVPTTHGDLSRGIFNALDSVMAGAKEEEIVQVSLSSTLATNAIVEDRGGPVGLLALGWKPGEEREFPRSKKAYVPGRFNARGEEVEPLRTDPIREIVSDWEDEVVGFAVSGYFSVRNPEHEKEVKLVLNEATDKPVVTGHELSSELGFYERGVTAVLNVKVIPIINSFLDSAEAALRERGIDAPVTMMKSDGSLASSSEIRKKPIETVFSGPAASVIGARWLSGREDGVVVDIGGTTADIGILREGLPSLDETGVQVGKWRTKVKSLDLHTVGLGGDSQVKVDEEGNFHFGPETAKPLAFADLSAKELERVETFEDPTFLKKSQTTEGPGEQLGRAARKFYDLIGEGLINRQELLNRAREEGLIRNSYYLRKLERLGYVRRTGPTPTDLLHVTGKYTAGDGTASRLGLEALSEDGRPETDEFAGMLRSKFEGAISEEIIKRFVLDSYPECDFGDSLIWDYCRGNSGKEGLSVNFVLDLPLIGVGAPADAFLPRVASRLDGEFVEVENYQVGNAVGTVTGRITRRFEVPLVENPETEEFLLFLPDRREVIEEDDEELALEEAKNCARESARRMVEAAGGRNIEISVEADDIIHGRSTVSAIAVGQPNLKWAN
ncbi:MAG: hydantoinase/oxoprolinase family protein [Candidatus Bipolaricaulota bacterium]